MESAIRPNEFPQELRSEFSPYKLLFEDPIGFQRPLTRSRLKRGESLEKQHGDGKLTDRRAMFRLELAELKNRGRDVQAICEVLGEAKGQEVRAVCAREGFGLARRACQQDLKNLNKLRQLLTERILPSTIWREFVTDTEISQVVAFTEWLDSPRTKLKELIDLPHRGKGRPRKWWRKKALKRLRKLRVSEERSEELFRIVGLVPLDDKGSDRAVT